MIDHPPPPDILMDARQETVRVGDHCSGERYICDIPEYGGWTGSKYSRYEECDRKATCGRYMSPKVVLGSGPTMRMPEEKPCPHYKEWKK